MNAWNAIAGRISAWVASSPPRPPARLARRSPAPKRTEIPLDGIPVLVVEDDLSSQKLLRLVLEGAGAEVELATSAEDALVILESYFKPRAVVVDIVLPRMSGLVFVELLKKQKHTADLVVVAVSAMNGPEVERMARDAGCVAYRRKPIDNDELVTLIGDALRGDT